ncbi:hypothetical protein [Gemmobacter sp.]|uniref:hypothetical protein n=1 Tax=Gemmobacter sp. TaxID=1898957 RepID=UPI002AFDE8EC|nr:hypothetical protein [Gemmobacter sp.]
MASLKERLRAFLGLDTSDFDRGLDRSGKRVRQFGQQAQGSIAAAFSRMSGLATGFVGGLGAGLVTTALSSISTDLAGTIKAIAQVGDEAKRSGLGIKAFQEWKFVAEQNRIGVDQLVDGFKELSLRADEWIVTGGGAASEAFQRLGYSAGDLKTKLKDPSALMLEIIGRLGRLDKAAQIRISDELFGGSAGERFVELLGQGEDGLRRLIARGHQVGAVMDEQMIAKADELDRRYGEMTARMDNFHKRMVVGAFEAVQEYARLREENRSLFRVFETTNPAYALMGAGIDLVTAATAEAQTEAQKLTAALNRDLSQAMGAIGWQAETLAAGLAEDADALDLMGRSADAEPLRAFASEINGLVADFARTKDAQAFADGLAEVNRKAVIAYDDIKALDGIKLGGVIGQIGDLALALLNALGIARNLQASLPGSGGYVSSGRGNGASEAARRREDLNPWKDDPSVSTGRPKRAPNDMWWLDPEDTGKSGGSSGKRDRHSLSAIMERTRADIAELEAEAAVLLAVASGNRELGDAMEYAKKKAELLAAAKKEGKEITPQLAAEIDQLAMAYMTAGLSAEDAADKIDNIRDATERGEDAMTDLFGAILEGSASAKQALASLLMQMAKVQFSQAMLGILGGTSWGKTLISSVGLSIGKNANGTTNWAGGLTMIGERGAELVSLPRGSQVFSALDSQRMMGNASAGASITVYSDPSVVVRAAEGAAVRVVQRAAPGIMAGAVQAARTDAQENPWP